MVIMQPSTHHLAGVCYLLTAHPWLVWEEVTSKLSTLVENIWYFATLFAVTIASIITYMVNHAMYLYIFAIAGSYLTTDVCNS